MNWVTAILIPAAALAVAYLSYRNSTKVQRRTESAASKAVDAAAYDRARKLYDGVIDQLNESRSGLHREVQELRSEVSDLRDANNELLEQVRRLRNEISNLNHTNQQLQAELDTLRR